MTTTLSIAFFAGLISFLSPCVLPLIPGYISYISGTSFDKIKEKKRNLIIIKTKENPNVKKIVLKTIKFFSFSFILYKDVPEI